MANWRRSGSCEELVTPSKYFIPKSRAFGNAGRDIGIRQISRQRIAAEHEPTHIGQ
jgi:hypothetical protein